VCVFFFFTRVGKRFGWEGAADAGIIAVPAALSILSSSGVDSQVSLVIGVRVLCISCEHVSEKYSDGRV